MKNNITWFDVPVTDLDRAIRFYSAVLGSPVTREQTGSIPIGMLPTPDGEKMGCLVSATTPGHRWTASCSGSTSKAA